MPLISLRRLIDSGRDMDSAMRRVVGLLLEALALQAPVGDPTEREQFQVSLRKLNADLAATTDESELLIAGGEIIKTLEAYSRSLERFWQIRGRELHSMITLLTHKLVEMADRSEASCRKLMDIEKNLRSASQVDDLRVLRARLEESLAGISQEAQRQATHSEEIRQHARGLGDRLNSAAALMGSHLSGVDRATGLPDRSVALGMLQDAMQNANSQTYAVAFCVERASIIGQRFGLAAADSVLMIYAQHIAQRLAPGDQLFHWQGSCILALCPGRSTKAGIAMEARRICAARFEHSVQIDEREVLIPVSAACLVARMRDYDNLEELVGIFDRFAGERSRDPQIGDER
jgi:GGDEF domain-containing protein